MADRTAGTGVGEEYLLLEKITWVRRRARGGGRGEGWWTKCIERYEHAEDTWRLSQQGERKTRAADRVWWGMMRSRSIAR